MARPEDRRRSPAADSRGPVDPGFRAGTATFAPARAMGKGDARRRPGCFVRHAPEVRPGTFPASARRDSQRAEIRAKNLQPKTLRPVTFTSLRSHEILTVNERSRLKLSGACL